MEITYKKQEPTSKVFTIKIEPKDYEPKLNSELKQIRKTTQIRGFRKGTAPMGYLKKLYGKDILNQELGKLLQESLDNFYQSSTDNMLGSALMIAGPESINVSKPITYEFDFEVGIAPDFDIPLLTGEDTSEFKHYIIVPDQQTIDEEINNIRERLGSFQEVDLVAEKDIVEIKLEELNEAGEVSEAGITHTVWLALSSFTDAKLQQLIGLAKGDVLDIQPFNDFQHTKKEVIKQILGIRKQVNIHKFPENFQMTINNVKRLTAADLDEQFFERIRDVDVSDEESLRKKITDQLNQGYYRTTAGRFNSELANYLIRQTPMDLPYSFLSKYVQQNVKEGVTDKELEFAYMQTLFDIKWRLIKGKILEAFHISVQEEELQQEITNNALSQWHKTHGNAMRPTSKQLNQLVKDLAENESAIEQAQEQVREQKIFTALRTKIKMVNVSVSAVEYQEIITQEYAKANQPEPQPQHSEG